jgi:predicted Rossmann fold nucleotide-binding protein DprA/Smf involved in DNA uptake
MVTKKSGMFTDLSVCVSLRHTTQSLTLEKRRLSMNLTPDAQAMLLLCSHVGLSNRPTLKPLKLREWNRIARNLQESSLQRPGALLEVSEEEIATALNVSEEVAQRLAQLLARGGGLAIELERLESLGIWVITRADAAYPQKWRKRLRTSAPPILFGAGEKALLGQPGVAVVGSRNVSPEGKQYAAFIGDACAYAGLVLYSGGARGVDSISTQAALDGRGTAVSILAHSLERTIRQPETRQALVQGDLALVTPYAPSAGFSVGAAMGRNKLIYTLADYAVVVASSAGKGGTWNGATEALKHQWVPIFVLEGPDMPEGNRRLLKKGAMPLPQSRLTPSLSLRDWLATQTSPKSPGPSMVTQGQLFAT